jgi:hypothetical protein
MHRRHLLRLTALAALFPVLRPALGPAIASEGDFPFKLTDAEWRAKLTPLQYAVLREEDTERAGTSPLDNRCRGRSAPRKTTACSQRGPRCIASAAAGISGISSTMVRSRRGCAIA